MKTFTIRPLGRGGRHKGADDDLITGYKICATLDRSTRAICRSLDGLVFPKHEGPRPPFYRGCRCVALPVTKPWRELGLDIPEFPIGDRASMGGPVPANWTYYDWLSRQPEQDVEWVLGFTRARLLIHGGLTPQEFAALQLDWQRKPRTIAQMRALAQEAFERAGIPVLPVRKKKAAPNDALVVRRAGDADQIAGNVVPIHCNKCNSTKFHVPHSPHSNSLIRCDGCEAVMTFGELQEQAAVMRRRLLKS